MSVALLETRGLAGPVDLLPMEPPTTGVELDQDVFEAAPPPSDPSWLVQARNLARDNPDSVTALVRSAQAELSAGKSDLAVRTAIEALDAMDGEIDAPAADAGIRILINAEAYEAAETHMARFGRTSDSLAFLYAALAARRGDVREASRRIEGLEGNRATALKAWLALQEGRYSDAIRLYRLALKQGDISPSILTNLGYAHAAVGVVHRAIVETQEARALAPSSRLIGLNLVAFSMATGDREGALREIEELRKFFPHDVGLHFAEADVHASSGDQLRAYKLLRRVRTSLWGYASLHEQSELTANLAFLAWRLKKMPREEAASAVIAELEKTEFQNLHIAALLPGLLSHSHDAGRIARIVKELEAAKPAEPLYLLRLHLHFLRRDFEETVDLAVRWAEAELFDPAAAGAAMYFLTDVRGDYEGAIRIGQSAFRRMPASISVRNNLAYALVLAGRPDDARPLVRHPGDSVHLTATRALVDLATGRTREGLRGYEQAYELAAERADDELRVYVALNRALAVRRFIGPSSEDGEFDLPPDWEDDPQIVLLRQVASRDLGIAEDTLSQ